jgi:hypothetical protein
LCCDLFLAQGPFWLWPLAIAWWLYSFLLAMGILVCSPKKEDKILGFFMRPLLKKKFQCFLENYLIVNLNGR